jgi:copper chaperone NosL
MKIVDPRFGGELVSSKGRVFKFDAIECLVPYLQEHATTDYAQVLAIAYDRPETLVDVQELVFERDSAYRSPMGGNLAAFTQAAAKEGKWMDWEEVKQTIGSPPNSTNY